MIVLTSPFGPRVHPKTGEVHLHTGIDIRAPVGTRALAPMGGRVTRVDQDGIGKGSINGNAVHIQAGPYRWSLLHLSRIFVAPGDTLGVGQVVGLTGNTGRSTAPHLHLQLTYQGRPVDPVPLFPPGTFRRK